MHLLLIDETDNKIVLQKFQTILKKYILVQISQLQSPNKDTADAMKIIIINVFFALYPASINL